MVEVGLAGLVRPRSTSNSFSRRAHLGLELGQLLQAALEVGWVEEQRREADAFGERGSGKKGVEVLPRPGDRASAPATSLLSL